MVACLSQDASAFQSSAPMTPAATAAATTSSSQLQMGLFDSWSAGGSADKDDLDEQWKLQQEILKNRRAPKEERDKYFEKVEKRRKDASDKQADMWAWQTKKYGKGEDPITEWKKRRESGQISDLDNQYGDEKSKGGIPLPMASFGVGGEFGGKFPFLCASFEEFMVFVTVLASFRNKI